MCAAARPPQRRACEGRAISDGIGGAHSCATRGALVQESAELELQSLLPIVQQLQAQIVAEDRARPNFVPKAGVQASLTIDADYDTLSNNPFKLAGFKAEVVTEMARELMKAPSEIQITSLRAGSTILDVFIAEIDPVRAAALEAQIRSGPLSKQVGRYSVKAVAVSAVKLPSMQARPPSVECTNCARWHHCHDSAQSGLRHRSLLRALPALPAPTLSQTLARP